MGGWIARWMGDLRFDVLLAVFQSYQHNGREIMKDCNHIRIMGGGGEIMKDCVQ